MRPMFRVLVPALIACFVLVTASWARVAAITSSSATHVIEFEATFTKFQILASFTLDAGDTIPTTDAAQLEIDGNLHTTGSSVSSSGSPLSGTFAAYWQPLHYGGEHELVGALNFDNAQGMHLDVRTGISTVNCDAG